MEQLAQELELTELVDKAVKEHGARRALAEPDHVRAGRFEREHLVEAGGRVDVAVCHECSFVQLLDAPADLGQGRRWYVAKGAIDLAQDGDDGIAPGPMLPDRLVDQFREFQVLGYLFHDWLSTALYVAGSMPARVRQ